MKRFISSTLFMFVCLLASYPMLATANSPLKVINMQVEYVTEPKGLDIERPRFSWVYALPNEDIRGLSQGAYRILVADSPEKLQAGVGNMWDTKWVESSAMNQIFYQGRTLIADRTYYWKVMVRDNNGKESLWSPVKEWSTGFFSDQQWKGQWIGTPHFFDKRSADCNVFDPWFRKTIVLNKKVGRAVFFLASIGYHELYVNGQRVGEEVLAPAVTDHTKRARYVAYDIAPLLRKGENVIAVWLGTSWSIFPGYDLPNGRPSTPLFSGQVDFFEQENPTDQEKPMFSLRSDKSWRWKNSPNRLLGNWNFGHMGGEIWDDSKAEENWNKISYDDSQWSNAIVYPLKLKISAQNIDGNILVDEIKPVSITEYGQGDYRVDMGVNFAGWTAINVFGNPGDTVRFFFSEREQDRMTFNLHSALVIGRSGMSTFKNRFNYSSGRWITIQGAKRKPVQEDITGWLVRTGYHTAATFESSDSLQNWIFNTTRWNFENLSLGGFVVDCPQRERMGYGGDAHATTEMGMLNYDLAAFYSKWMGDWRDVQGTEAMVGNMRDTSYARKAVTSGRFLHPGILPHTAPTYWGGGGPSWGGIVVSLPWFMYQQYGDVKVLQENFTLIKNWLNFLDTHVQDGLLQRFGGQWDFLGDWLWPNATAEGMNNDKEETLSLNNSYRVFNLRTAVKIARVLGESALADAWEHQAQVASKAIHTRFFKQEGHVYADGSMANMATALLADIVPSEEKANVEAALEKEILTHRQGHIHAGITGGALLFKWLRESGRNDLIYTMTSKVTYPSWGYMKANQATSLWEMWEKDLPGHSLLHSSYLYPGAWMIDGLAGIKKSKPGYATFIIQPPKAQETNLSWVKASYDSPSGTIYSAWNREEDQLRMQVTVPPNTTCLLKIAKGESALLEHVLATYRIHSDDINDTYRLPSGTYIF